MYLSPKLADGNSALLIGNIITGCIHIKPTTLQIALGVFLREKELIEQCLCFDICSSHDESKDLKLQQLKQHLGKHSGLFSSDVCLIQAIVDNHDANVSSIDGMQGLLLFF